MNCTDDREIIPKCFALKYWFIIISLAISQLCQVIWKALHIEEFQLSILRYNYSKGLISIHFFLLRINVVEFIFHISFTITNYQAMEGLILKGKLGGGAVLRIKIVHPAIQGAESFYY